MSEHTRCFMIEINEERLKGKWDIVLSTEGYVSISSIGSEDDVEYSGMVHLGDADFQKLWSLLEKISPNYDEIQQLLINSNLNAVLEPLILYLKGLLNNQMDYT